MPSIAVATSKPALEYHCLITQRVSSSACFETTVASRQQDAFLGVKLVL